jgi:hypothetical protein
MTPEEMNQMTINDLRAMGMMIELENDHVEEDYFVCKIVSYCSACRRRNPGPLHHLVTGGWICEACLDTQCPAVPDPAHGLSSTL